MQQYEQYPEAARQTALPHTPPQSTNAAPIHAEDPQAVIDLLATATKETARRKWVALVGLWIAIQIATALPHTPGAVVIDVIVSLSLLNLAVSVFAVQYRDTATALAAVNDLRMVAPLIDRLRPSSKDRRVRPVVTRALMRLLPRLKSSDAALLTAEQKAELARHLGRLAMFQKDKDFQVVILRVLEQVGDAQAIPVVERIIRRKPRWSGQEQVQAAAVECLPFLLQRADEEKARNTLLRSAGAFAGETSELLHPVEGGEGNDPRQLLRGSPQTPDQTHPTMPV